MKIFNSKRSIVFMVASLLLSLNLVCIGAKKPVFSMSKYFRYDAAIKVDGYVIGWLEIPGIEQAVLISSDKTYVTKKLFSPKAGVDRKSCNYHYINPDMPKSDAPKGLYYFVSQVRYSEVIIGNSENSTRLQPAVKTFYSRVDSFYSRRVLMDFPEESYLLIDGDYVLYEPNKKKKRMTKWDERDKKLHPFSYELLKSHDEDERDFLEKRTDHIVLKVYKP